MQPLDNLFEALKLDYLAQQVDALLEQAAKKDLGYRELLTEALTCEWQGRKQKGMEARLAHARLPWLKTLEQGVSGILCVSWIIVTGVSPRV